MKEQKLYAQIRSPHETRTQWSFAERLKADGWYEIEREPNMLEDEYLEYDKKDDRILIKKREKSAEELKAEKQAEVKRQLVAELPDIILQNKDNPEALVQALCDRAKQIDKEVKNGKEQL